MIYQVIGLMSGSSLDGLDIAFVRLEEIRGKWSMTIEAAECIPYEEDWAEALKRAPEMSGLELAVLNTGYGTYLGESVRSFIERNGLEHKVHFVVSHGHTVHHDPLRKMTLQVGDGAALAVTCGLPAITDLRSSDIALGGQGAPIVPIGDELLFADYDYLLNIGGIANLTVRQAAGSPVAFDVCPANRVLNELACREGLAMDEGGQLAMQGEVKNELLSELENAPYYSVYGPKSLSNAQSRALFLPLIAVENESTLDLLRTAVALITNRVQAAVEQYAHGKANARMLVTGGGAFNTFLMEQLATALQPLNVSVEVPDAATVNFKEAVVMALIGTLRWREEINILNSVTGAGRSSIGGALWLP